MDTRLPSSQIAAILRDHLQPYACECRTEMDNSLSVRLYRETEDQDELTVMGITADKYRDTDDLIRLAGELRVELDATRGLMTATPSPRLANDA